jgi:GNAT superfamily N-acetyltransferase
VRPSLALTDAPDPSLRAMLGAGLTQHNLAAAGYSDWRALAVVVSDAASGETLGGLVGRTSLGVLFIDLVHLPETVRGQGIGREMIGMAEAEARARGCRAGVLYTITLQAPGFYEKLGWREFGRIPCDPPGHARVFMCKDFA